MKRFLLFLIIILIFTGFGIYAYYKEAKSVADASAYAPYYPNVTTSNSQATSYAAPAYAAPAPTYTGTPAYTAPAPVYTPTAYAAPTAQYPTYPTTPTYTAPTYNYAPVGMVVQCPRGFQPNPGMTACVPVYIPPHAHLDIFGSSYQCDPGYDSLGNSCVRYSSPVDYYGGNPYPYGY